MSSRFDNRSKEQFKKHIKFTTMLEKYFFNKWLDIVKDSDTITVSSWGDNGCGNDGEFIPKGNTAGADYKISGLIRGGDGVDAELKDEPLEIKWVPTAGKFTLKEGDLKAYVRESASILFIYNSVKCGEDLRVPKKDYNLSEHIKKIELKADQLKWGIMWSPKVKQFYNHAKDNELFRPISYMGGKQGVVLKQENFGKWFKEKDWSNETIKT